MIPYWILFAYFAAGAALDPWRRAPGEKGPRTYLLIGILLMTLMIGIRREVGGDWRSYQSMFDIIEHVSFGQALKFGDPGYQALNWIVQQWNGEIWWVNLFSAAIFAWGLLRLCQNQPMPLLAVLVAVPYLIIVVAMGYTRQSIAIGILMAGLASLGRGGSVLRFAIYVAVAALFHKTAVLVLPLVIFAGKRNRLLNVIAGAAAFFLFFDLFLANSTSQFFRTYVDAQYTSQGALIRVILILVPAVVLLARRRQLGLAEQEEKVWRYIAFAACAMPLILIATPSSTAVDRMALFLLPLQIVVLSRVHLLFNKPRTGIAVIIFYSFMVQFVWLNFAQHAKLWVPYHSFMIEEDTTNRRSGGNDRN